MASSWETAPTTFNLFSEVPKSYFLVSDLSLLKVR
jgi:hypothetical protein